MKERGFCLLLFCVPVGIILFILTFFFINSFIIRENVYYIPEVNIYIKTLHKPKEKYGCIFFNTENKWDINDKKDYIKIYKNLGFDLLLNKNNKKEVFIKNYYTKEINEIKSIKFTIIEGLDKYDTLFFEKTPQRYLEKIREPYLGIKIDNDFNSLYVKDSGVENFTKISPIK